jgi:hypothetical protein
MIFGPLGSTPLGGSGDDSLLDTYVSTQVDTILLTQEHNLTVANAHVLPRLEGWHDLAPADLSVITQADALTVVRLIVYLPVSRLS